MAFEYRLPVYTKKMKKSKDYNIRTKILLPAIPIENMYRSRWNSFFFAWYFCLEEKIKICNPWVVVYDFSKYMLPSTYTIFKIYFHLEINKNYHYSVKNNSKSVIFWFEEISENTILDNRTFKMRFCVSISCCWNTYHQYNKKKVNHQNLCQ